MYSILLNSYGQSDNLKKNDKILLGFWKGAEFDEVTLDIKKHWLINRLENGTYIILGTSLDNCKVKFSNEKGTWWTDNGKLYQLNDNSKVLKIFNYRTTDLGSVEIFFSENPCKHIKDCGKFFYENKWE